MSSHRLGATHAPLHCVQNVLEAVVYVVETDGGPVEVEDNRYSQPVAYAVCNVALPHLFAGSVVNSSAPVIAWCDVRWNPKLDLELAFRHCLTRSADELALPAICGRFSNRIELQRRSYVRQGTELRGVTEHT